MNKEEAYLATISNDSIQSLSASEATPLLHHLTQEDHTVPLRSCMKTPGAASTKSVSWSDKRDGKPLVEVVQVPSKFNHHYYNLV